MGIFLQKLWIIISSLKFKQITDFLILILSNSSDDIATLDPQIQIKFPPDWPKSILPLPSLGITSMFPLSKTPIPPILVSPSSAAACHILPKTAKSSFARARSLYPMSSLPYEIQGKRDYVLYTCEHCYNHQRVLRYCSDEIGKLLFSKSRVAVGIDVTQHDLLQGDAHRNQRHRLSARAAPPGYSSAASPKPKRM